MKLDILKIPRDRQKVALTIRLLGSTQPPAADKSIEEVVNIIEREQDEWVEEILDDDVVGMLNVQFDNMFGDSD